jgi:hypothetical protein
MDNYLTYVTDPPAAAVWAAILFIALGVVLLKKQLTGLDCLVAAL